MAQERKYGTMELKPTLEVSLMERKMEKENSLGTISHIMKETFQRVSSMVKEFTTSKISKRLTTVAL
jgi:hypothetical protein